MSGAIHPSPMPAAPLKRHAQSQRPGSCANLTQSVPERRAKLWDYRRFDGLGEAMPRVATACHVMPSNAHLPRSSVHLDTTYAIHHFSGFIGEKAHAPTVADYVSDIETQYLYALATGQLIDGQSQ